MSLKIILVMSQTTFLPSQEESIAPILGTENFMNPHLAAHYRESLTLPRNRLVNKAGIEHEVGLTLAIRHILPVINRFSPNNHNRDQNNQKTHFVFDTVLLWI